MRRTINKNHPRVMIAVLIVLSTIGLAASISRQESSPNVSHRSSWEKHVSESVWTADTVEGLNDSQEIDFNRDIRPILSSRCLNCHGPDEETREAGLRLDDFESATGELDSGFSAIVPGDIDESELVYRITTDDDSLRMPPSESGNALTEKEIDLLTRWIESGASYAQHWSFVSPVRPAPVTGFEGSARTEFDAYVMKRLSEHGLELEPAADRYTLIRRVALDLTGLPPTIDDVARFVDDQRPDAYERMVDRCLASPAFGEHWAAGWLDLARYADSQGYAQDPPRTIWRYRDWVIDTLNDGLSFDRFTIEQLAGDMFEGASESQRIATAFHRNTMTNSEGGTDNEEFRVAAVVDRVNTTMQVWMGLTVGCAQCHTHKYDPITQSEYFQLYDIFNQSEDNDRPNDAPFISSYSKQQLAQQASWRNELARLEPIVAEQLAATPMESYEIPSEGELKGRFVRVQALGNNVFLHLAEVEVFQGEDNLATSGAASQSSTDFGGPAERANDGNRDGHYTNAASTSHTAGEANPWWEVDLGSAASIDRIQIWNRTDTEGVRDRLNHYRIIVLDDARKPVWIDESREIPKPDRQVVVPTQFSELNQDVRVALAAYQSDSPIDPTPEATRLAELEKALADQKPAIQTPIMQELAEAQRRETRIHIRGNFRQQSDVVHAGVPDVFPPLPEERAPNRLVFAEWLVSANNPLTARVVVNRYWEALFGVGLVSTSEDFGTQGQLPEYQNVLDWLAVDLIENGWDTKRLIRQIVNSATYRQSSRVSFEKLTADPFNRLLSRGPRFRLSAETIRDQALHVAGLLSHTMRGPSVQPPRPNLGLRAAFGGSTDWTTSPGEDRYRRGLYTSWRRTTPYPSMTTFDATSREVCTIRRIRTNTPLQALVTLNDPVFVEAAQGLARRVLQDAEPNDHARCTMAFQLVLARQPNERELGVLVSTLSTARHRLAAQPDSARLLATEPIGPLPAEVDAVEAAALTLIGNVILNLDEALARP